MLKQPKHYIGDKNLPILVNQLKQYVKNEKQILFFSKMENFPSTGKVSNLYVDESTGDIWRYDIDDGYYLYLKISINNDKIITIDDNVILNCGDSDELIILS